MARGSVGRTSAGTGRNYSSVYATGKVGVGGGRGHKTFNVDTQATKMPASRSDYNLAGGTRLMSGSPKPGLARQKRKV